MLGYTVRARVRIRVEKLDPTRPDPNKVRPDPTRRAMPKSLTRPDPTRGPDIKEFFFRFYIGPNDFFALRWLH